MKEVSDIGKINNPPSAKPSDLAIERQTTYDPAANTFAVCCGVCRKVKIIKKMWYRSRDGTMRILRREFNFCGYCNRWVCEDCFIVDDGTGGVAICTECAKEQGITGYTNAQFKAAWPEIKRRRRENYEKTLQDAQERGKPSPDSREKQTGEEKGETK
jgi:hypothetical protein